MAFNPGALNPNAPAQLASLSAGQLQNILSQFAGKTVVVWDIDEAAFLSNGAPSGTQPAVFHVFKTAAQQGFQAGLTSVNDSYGRRKVKYQFPYKDGQTSDDLGKKPAEYDFDAIIHGPNYLAGVQNLFNQLALPGPGVLTHPVFGDIDVIVEEYSVVHSSDTRLAAQIRIKFSEQSFTIQDTFDISQSNSNSFTSQLAGVLTALSNFQNLANAVTANLQAISTVYQQTQQAVAAFSSFYALTAGQINAAFNSNPSSIPSLFPVNQGGLLNSSGQLTNPAVSTNSLSPNDPFAFVPLSTLSAAAQAAIQAQSVQKQVQAAWNNGATLIQTLEATQTPNGPGSLVFHDNLVDIKNSLLALESSMQAGLASATFKIFQYTTPRNMSAREVCFLNGISLDNVANIAALNPSLDNTNDIPINTVLTVAV